MQRASNHPSIENNIGKLITKIEMREWKPEESQQQEGPLEPA